MNQVSWFADAETQARDVTPGEVLALAWTSAEDLEDGLEARLLPWRGRKIGLAFHSSRGGAPRTVLMGPVAEALGEPDGWLDGLDSSAVLDRPEDALLGLPAGQLEEALASYGGCPHGEGSAGPAAPGIHAYSPIAL